MFIIPKSTRINYRLRTKRQKASLVTTE